MIPREPPRSPQMGFLYIPPYRVQGISIAGERSVVQVPELDVAFDIGDCPKPVLTADYVALTHGHMDHAAGFAYYFSQRHFQGIGCGTVICHPSLKEAIEQVMQAWANVEAQRTPFQLIGLEPEGEIEIKDKTYLRGFETVHTVPSLGYVVIERRNKLKPDLIGTPQEKIVELKQQGHPITQTHQIPLVCYTGDTAMGPHFERDDVLDAKVLITECTFLEAGDRDRAGSGKHLHLDDVIELLERSRAEAVVLTHLSRRTHIVQARRTLEKAIPSRHRDRVLILMDSRTNRQRYERQVREAEEGEGVRGGKG